MNVRKKKTELIQAVKIETDDTPLAESLDVYARSILTILAKHSAVHLESALNSLAVNDPGVYVKACLSLMPKNVKVDMNVTGKFDEMSLKEMLEAYEIMRIENEQELQMLGLQPGEVAEFDKPTGTHKPDHGRENKGARRRTVKH